MNYELEKFDFNLELLQKIIQSNILLYCAVLLLVLKTATILIPINFPQNIFFADITKTALENFTNQTRESAGLTALVENQKLDNAAKMKAENMVQNQYFNHTSPTGITPWRWFSQAGYDYKYAGENLAIGFYDSKEVYNAWLNSAPHKANLLNPNYKETGIAVLSGFGQNNAVIVVQLFASPKTQLAPVPPTDINNSLNINNQKVNVEKPELKPEVLSQSTEAPAVLKDDKTYGLLQDIIYGVSLIVISILFIMIFSNIKFKKELVFRAVFIVILLSAAALLNTNII